MTPEQEALLTRYRDRTDVELSAALGAALAKIKSLRAAQRWQPIETAPKGELFIAIEEYHSPYTGDDRKRVILAAFDETLGWFVSSDADGNGYELDGKLIAWKEYPALPAPPEAAQRKENAE